MNTPLALGPTVDESVSHWERMLYAFLAEKESRSGSRRTVESYSGLLRDFFGRAGKAPDQIAPQDVFVWAHGVGLSGRQPSSSTISSRISCVSSFYRFAIRMGTLVANPCDALERPKIQVAPARGLSADQVRQLLDAVPDSVAGRRDRAIVLTLALTGRRRTEVMSMMAGAISLDDGTPFYRYRGKGGKRGERGLPRPAFDAIQRMLADRGVTLHELEPDTNLWGISGSTFYSRFRRYLASAGLPTSGLHVLRHTAAKLRRDAGASVEDVSAFLDHSSLAVTSIYLRRLETPRDETWESVARAIGAA